MIQDGIEIIDLLRVPPFPKCGVCTYTHIHTHTHPPTLILNVGVSGEYIEIDPVSQSKPGIPSLFRSTQKPVSLGEGANVLCAWLQNLKIRAMKNWGRLVSFPPSDHL